LGSMQSVLYMMMVVWIAVTVVLVVMMIYRSALENREEDQLFLDAAESHIAAEQRSILSKIQKLRVPIMTLMVLSGALFAAIAGLWVYRGFETF
jgi:Tfp pilus assembly protein PilN